MATRLKPQNGSGKYGKPMRAQKDFSRIPSIDTPRSTFNRSCGHKTTFDAGLLIPVFVDEVLPGDTFHLTTNCIARLATPIVPIMDNMVLDVHYFFVPNRLVWDNFPRFMGERRDPGDSVDFTVPQVFWPNGINLATCADYFGLPTNTPNISVSALPFRAYSLIYNEWYRDQNLMDSIDFATDDGNFSAPPEYLWPQPRCKRHDYFTSCLPWPQKGAGVELPLGVPSMVLGTPKFNVGGVTSGLYSWDADDEIVRWTDNVPGSVQAVWADAGITLEPSEALTINTLRQAFQIQKMLERDARGGTRYVEIIRSHFGVISPDARMQRPEYLGMSSFDVNINPVAQTAGTDSTTPQGNLAAYGVVGGSKRGFSQSFTEHGHIIGIASVRADLTYQQGINRMWSRKTRFDYYWPSLAHLGEQAVLNGEIYATGTDADDNVFGYQERHAEYRYKPSQITGKLRSVEPTSLDAWHLAQFFENAPVLNAEFIKENIPLDRCIAVQDEPHFIADFNFQLTCVRAMPTYSVPGLIDHF